MNLSDADRKMLVDFSSMMKWSPPSDEDDDHIELAGGQFSLERGQIEVEHPSSIAKTKEVFKCEGWILCEVICLIGSHWEPPDCDYEVMSTSRNLSSVLEDAAHAELQYRINNFLESTMTAEDFGI